MRLISRKPAAYALLMAGLFIGVSSADAHLTSNGINSNGIFLNGTDVGQTLSIESVALSDGSVIAPSSD